MPGGGALERLQATLCEAELYAGLAGRHAHHEPDYLAGHLDRAVVEAAVVPGRFELPPVSGVRYFGFVDPSGGSSDSMTLAISHREKNGVAVLEAISERRSPFSPEDVTGEFA